MKYIAVYIGSNNEFQFFSRMSSGLEVHGFRLVFISNKLSIIFKALLHAKKTAIVKAATCLLDIPELKKCADLRKGITSVKKAEILYSSVYSTFQKVNQKYSPEFIFIWNGLSIQTLAASEFCRINKIRTRYFELANLPGKVFVNPYGVNARSGLYNNPEVLKEYNVSEEEYSSWKKQHYIDINVTRPNKKINCFFFLDLLGFRLLKLPENGETGIYNKCKELFSSKIKMTYDEYDIYSNKYIFLPLQVNMDTQLLFNSDINNYDAISAALKIAENEKKDLLVKVHPAETDNMFLRTIKEIRNKLKIFLVNYPTRDLILNSHLVVTINSTVGLESMILNKPVKFLGKTFYTKLKGEYLRNYILKYLVDGEYYSRNEFGNEAVGQILNIR